MNLLSAGSNIRCYQCNERAVLFKCSRCKVSRYCSVECQKTAWQTTHRFICTPHAITGGMDAINAQVTSAKSFWDHWRYSLEVWMLFALDYGNRPADYLTRHCFVLDLERRDVETSRSKLYAVKSASFMAHADFERIMHRILPLDDGLRNSVVNRAFGPWVTPLETVIRYCIICEGVFLGGMQELPFLESYLRENGKRVDLGEMRSTTKGRLLSRRLQEGYERALMSQVDEGNLDGYLIHYEVENQAALSVIDMGSRAAE